MLAILIAAATAAAAPGTVVKGDPVTQPEWLAAPNKTLMMNCTTGYLTDPNFSGESIVMGCVVRPDGMLGQCMVKESKRAQAAGVQDVAVCASSGFRIGPKDKQGKPTAGRPILIPMGIATLAPGPAPAAATPANTTKPKT